MDTREKIYGEVCRQAGVPVGTDAGEALDAWLAMWDKRAAAVGLRAGATVPAIVAAERKARGAVRLAAALSAAGGATAGQVVGGVRLLSKEEAEEVLNFSLDTPLLRRRVEATEAALGKDLRQALQDQDLR